MTKNEQVADLASSPEDFIELCSQVLTEMHSRSFQSESVFEIESQIKVINTAISQLECLNLSVPDSLRTEKLNLTTEIFKISDARKSFHAVVDELNSILLNFAEAPKNVDSNKAKRRSRRIQSGSQKKLPRTSKTQYEQLIIEALRHHGGSATITEVRTYIGNVLKDSFTPTDLSDREGAGMSIWQNDVAWARLSLRRAGVLRADSPRGTWELSEDFDEPLALPELNNNGATDSSVQKAIGDTGEH